MIPTYWIDFLNQHKFRDAECEIPLNEMDSALSGCNILVLNENEISKELEAHDPDHKLSEKGFIPVGTCIYSTGETYFINENEGKNGHLYRVYDDELFNPNIEHTIDTIDMVLDHYEDLIRFKQH